MQSTRATATLAALVIATGALVACTNDKPTPPTTTTPSPISVDPSSESSSSSASSSSSSSSADDLPADYPEAAKQNTKAGAAAFGKYYYETFGEATHTGKTGTLEMLDSSKCLVCSDGVANIQKDAEKGWTRSVNPYTMRQVEAVKRPDEGYKVSMRVKVVAHQRLDSDGRPNANVRAADYTLTEHVIWQDDRWQMMDWIVT